MANLNLKPNRDPSVLGKKKTQERTENASDVCAENEPLSATSWSRCCSMRYVLMQACDCRVPMADLACSTTCSATLLEVRAEQLALVLEWPLRRDQHSRTSLQLSAGECVVICQALRSRQPWRCH
jgi:hypothetical protein